MERRAMKNDEFPIAGVEQERSNQHEQFPMRAGD